MAIDEKDQVPGGTRRSFVMASAAMLGSFKVRAQARVELTFAHSAGEDNPRHLAAELFAKRVAEGSGGRIRVVVHPASRLADDAKAIEGLMAGRIDLTANSQGPVASVVPEFASIGLPYVFETQQQVWRVLAGEVGNTLRNRALERGLRVLGFWDNGFRQMTNSRRPIRRPEDVAGLKIRTPTDPVTIALMRALGAETVVIPFSELVKALGDGRADGQENPLVNIYTAHLYKVQRYLALTNHKVECTPLLMSEQSWSRLSAADQGVLRSAAAEATLSQRQAMLKADERSFSGLYAGDMQISHVDAKAFQKASHSVVEQWMGGPTGSFVTALLAAARAAA